MIKETLAAERIKKIQADDEGVILRYQTRLRLFGLISIEREIEARSDTDGNIEIDYPWYRFLSITPDHGTLLNTMQVLIRVPN